MTPALAAKAYSAAADIARGASPVQPANTGAEPAFGSILADYARVTSPAAVAKTGAEFEFGSMLADQITGLSAQGHAAEQTSLKALDGSTDAVSLVTAVAETELALETMISVRDKVIAAYEEIMRMPI
ncbi:flagellar hook-basal body complex protein FliE [Tepidamorphus gemmatus]|uniref:Flagellar hook-basal body complex protein FliE n=1 Tax=Tepidamorphus gemmatus TaxID=747076 RepID=A0A4R3ML75_9HYPH|nr:flagellar hook-basal body complex protein FliE [Tepidamorphus gemmatus]TCT13538.1 flagellar hook-basal body complex protein FliE [Tepidamorphus gemmatus]